MSGSSVEIGNRPYQLDGSVPGTLAEANLASPIASSTLSPDPLANSRRMSPASERRVRDLGIALSVSGMLPFTSVKNCEICSSS